MHKLSGLTILETLAQPHALWHPFADMPNVDRNRMVISRAEGAWVWDSDGRRYLDATASLWYANLGHAREEIIEAVQRQLRKLDSFNLFGDYANEPALELADRLAQLAPESASRVFLGAGGSDMIDTAAKIARSYHARRGEPNRIHLIGRAGGFHGTHGFGTSVGGIAANAAGFGPLIEDVSSVTADDPELLEAEILRIGPTHVAAFFCEPVIGAGGVYIPPPGYIEAVASICRRHGVLFVADCVICGFGRLGTWLGIDRWPVQPDLIALAKGLSGGVLPVGALIVAPHVAAPFFEAAAPPLRHGHTYAGHPTCCAAANAAIELYARDGLIERGRLLERPLADALAPLEQSPLVSEVRAGLGFLGAVAFSDEAMRALPGLPARVQQACRISGVLVRPLLQSVAVSPPLICDEQDIATIAQALGAGLAALEPELAACLK